MNRCPEDYLCELNTRLAMRTSENIYHCRSFSSLWCSTYYSTPSVFPCGPAPSNTHLPHTVALLIKSLATISWVEMLTSMIRNDIWLWHFPSRFLSQDLAYIPFLSSTEPRGEAIILTGYPLWVLYCHWRDGTSYPSNYTIFLFSWTDTSLSFEAD